MAWSDAARRAAAEARKRKPKNVSLGHVRNVLSKYNKPLGATREVKGGYFGSARNRHGRLVSVFVPKKGTK